MARRTAAGCFRAKLFMPLLFRIYRDEQQELWIVLMADQLYGEYLDKVRAVLDAIETAEESRLAASKSKYGMSPRGYTKCAMRYSDKPAWLHKRIRRGSRS